MSWSTVVWHGMGLHALAHSAPHLSCIQSHLVPLGNSMQRQKAGCPACPSSPSTCSTKPMRLRAALLILCPLTSTCPSREAALGARPPTMDSSEVLPLPAGRVGYG